MITFHRLRAGLCGLLLLALAACGQPDRGGAAQPTATSVPTCRPQPQGPCTSELGSWAGFPTAEPFATLLARERLPTVRVMPTVPTTPTPTPRIPAFQPLATTVGEHVLRSGDDLVWVELQNLKSKHPMVLGYHLRTQTPFSLFEITTDGNTFSMQTQDSDGHDGTQVVWVQLGGYFSRIQRYDAQTGQTSTLLSGGRFSDPVLTDGVLYYRDDMGTSVDDPKQHTGLYAYTLATGQETLISAKGKRPVLGEGMLLWSEVGDGANEYVLYMRRLGKTVADTVVARSKGQPFGSYAISSHYVLWMGATSATLGLYDIDRGTEQHLTVPRTLAFQPLLNDRYAIWTTVEGDRSNPNAWAVQVYDIQAGQTHTAIYSSFWLKTWAVTEQAQVVFGIENQQGGDSLYLVDPAHEDAP